MSYDKREYSAPLQFNIMAVGVSRPKVTTGQNQRIVFISVIPAIKYL